MEKEEMDRIGAYFNEQLKALEDKVREDGYHIVHFGASLLGYTCSIWENICGDRWKEEVLNQMNKMNKIVERKNEESGS